MGTTNGTGSCCLTLAPPEPLKRPGEHDVEAVEKPLMKNQSYDARKTTSQNALYSTIVFLGGMNGLRKSERVLSRGLFLQPR